MRIFVYGSLRHKQGNSHWMTNAQLLGDLSITTSCIAWATIQAQFRGTEQYTVKFIVLTTPRWPNLMPCAPGAVNTRAS